MIPTAPMIAVPLHTDESGIIYVSGTRVTIDTLIARYQQGDTPERIHEGFPTVPVTDIYAVISYYLAQQDVVDAYLQRRDEEGERIRREIEAHYTPEQAARTEQFKALLAKKRRERGG